MRAECSVHKAHVYSVHLHVHVCSVHKAHVCSVQCAQTAHVQAAVCTRSMCEVGSVHKAHVYSV